jgi:hypothetical protein
MVLEAQNGPAAVGRCGNGRRPIPKDPVHQITGIGHGASW